MLAKVVVTKWDAKDARVDSAIDGTFLINMDRVNGIQTRATTKSSFYYSDNLWDRREAPRYVECDSTAAALKVASDLTWQSNFLALPIFTDNDSTKAKYYRYVHVDSISLVYEDKTSLDIYDEAERCWLEYFEGAFKKKKVLVDLDIDAILQYSDTGQTTT
jgi:hypothetical protein